MRKIYFAFLFVIILALDFAALDDITTGNEPDLFWEYAILFASIPLLAFLGYLIPLRGKPRA